MAKSYERYWHSNIEGYRVKFMQHGRGMDMHYTAYIEKLDRRTSGVTLKDVSDSVRAIIAQVTE